MQQSDTVRVEKQGVVTTVIIDRPHARNAVDRPTADALVKAFLAFESDAESLIAVLWGDHGTFCVLDLSLRSAPKSRPSNRPATRSRIPAIGATPLGTVRTAGST